MYNTTEERIKGFLKNIDWDGHNARVLHALQEPPCTCTPCYINWLKLGRRVYGEDTQRYEKRRDDALRHLKNKSRLRGESPARITTQISLLEGI